MKSCNRGWQALMVAPLLIGLAGCSEDNEKRLKTEGTTTLPGAPTSTEEALKQGAAAPDTKAVAPAGYPGANKKR